MDSNRSSKRGLITIDDEDSSSEQPAMKSKKSDAEPIPSQEVLELQKKVVELQQANAKLENNFQGVCRVAGEAQARVQFLENLIAPLTDIASVISTMPPMQPPPMQQMQQMQPSMGGGGGPMGYKPEMDMMGAINGAIGLGGGGMGMQPQNEYKVKEEEPVEIMANWGMAVEVKEEVEDADDEPLAVLAKVKEEEEEEEDGEGWGAEEWMEIKEEVQSTAPTVPETAFSISDEESLSVIRTKMIKEEKEGRRKRSKRSTAVSSTVPETAFSISDEESLAEIKKAIKTEEKQARKDGEYKEDEGRRRKRVTKRKKASTR